MHTLKHHIKPFQRPHPPIGIAGFSPGSTTLKLAGERGFLPLSLNLSPGYLVTHWGAVVEGAKISGRTPNRADWRLVREVFVADTDEEAYRHALKGAMARMMSQYLLPLFSDFQFLKYLKHDQSIPDSDVTPEYLVDHGWLVGSVKTVTRKLGEMYEETGGFGTLLLFVFDYAEDPEPWFKSMRLLAHEVLPHFQDRRQNGLAAAR
jgi:alkanesulfonate monooxygenase SsuD/methylene tetrahydromethanopterin reductase-like flavin-dependent oxidoreductase (luciferase family)